MTKIKNFMRYETYGFNEFFKTRKIPKNIKGPPIKTPIETISENRKKARTEATIGSPKGTEATAVGVRYLIT